MHLMLHIFKKDVRRLWWGVAIALLIQIAAAWFDAVEDVAVPLHDLLMVTWAVLLALAVHEDPLVGDRQFWLTRPARWRVLLGSKLLFALAVVHVPSFVADIVVLAARGFRPWEWLASILTKQLMLAAARTLPIIALSAVLRSFAHLVLAAIGILGITFLASIFHRSLSGAWTGVEAVRFVLMTAAVGSGAIAVVCWQFARRRTWRSRLVGIASVLGAELIFRFCVADLPRPRSRRLRSRAYQDFVPPAKRRAGPGSPEQCVSAILCAVSRIRRYVRASCGVRYSSGNPGPFWRSGGGHNCLRRRTPPVACQLHRARPADSADSAGVLAAPEERQSGTARRGSRPAPGCQWE
jgi:hypothetical protein